MPTFKHPCPHCGKYIGRDAATCPFCATVDPFAPARCPNCRTVIEDPAWATCPRCGQALTTPVAASGTASSQSASPAPQAGPPADGKCTGCGAPLAKGARFCTVCGTLAS